MGILNLTPDSFSGDGRQGKSVPQLLAYVDVMIGEGVDIIDVGAESTRPGASALTAAEEWERIAPLASALGSRTQTVGFSIDTYHPENALRALDAGFTWVNDVSGGSAAMLETVKPYNATLVLMHSLTVPADKNKTLPEDADVVAEVLAWGHKALAQTGKQRVVLDPGIGFGKTQEQSLTLIRHVQAFRAWGVPLLVGHSRKSFLGAFGDDRDAATLPVSAFLALQGVDYLRVHDVRAHRFMLDTQEVIT